MPKYVREPARRLKVAGTYDVVVAGGGPAGVAAAVAAARRGAKVTLIEQTGCLGGLGTAGLVPCFCPFSWEHPPEDSPAARGLALEVVQRLAAEGGSDLSEWPSIDAEKLKLVYDRLTADSGVEVRYFTFVAGAIVRRGRVEAVVVESKAGRQALAGKVFVDATGDADLAARAGAPFAKGDAAGRMQGVTLCFTVSGVDTRAYFAHFWKTFGGNGKMTRWLQQCQRAGKLPAVEGAEYRISCHKEIHPGTLGYNMGHVFGIDGTNPEDMGRAMRLGRQLAHHFVAFGRKHIPGMAKAHVVATAALPGIRETRRIRGRRELALADFQASRHSADDIAVYDYPIDVHPASGDKKETGRTDRQMETLIQPPGMTYGIPYRCLVPRGPANLLVAGRSISADRMMQGTTRVMPACLAMGQAAGIAAAIAARRGIPVAAVPVKELQAALLRDGARLK